MKLPKVKPGDRASLEWLLGRVHVGTPDAEVEADIRRRVARSTVVGPDCYTEALVAEALAIHHRNQALYLKVTGGRIR